MNAPLRPLPRPSSDSRSNRRQDLIAARRFDCISLTREEFTSLPADAQHEYCRQVRAAQPRLYFETPADIIKRWRRNDAGARDRDFRSDHSLALHEGEREVAENP